MKNAGMAGAVALVGIGLITIGLSNFSKRAEAVPAAPSTITLAQQEAREAQGAFISGCYSIAEEEWFEAEGQLLCGSRFDIPSTPEGDFNGDGRPDRLYFNSFAWNGNTFLGYGQAGFQFSSLRYSDGVAEQVLVPMTQGIANWHRGAYKDPQLSVYFEGLADVDGDGRRDLVVWRSVSYEVYWHRNITDGNPLVADLNRDGFVNGADMGLLIAAWTG